MVSREKQFALHSGHQGLSEGRLPVCGLSAGGGQRREERDNAAGLARLNGLAAFTASATGGDAADIESAGFSVRAARTPTQALPAPAKVLARTNDWPGHTQLRWVPLPGAKSYMIQRCADPMTADGWEFATSCTAASADVNGSEPGARCWYRVAG